MNRKYNIVRSFEVKDSTVLVLDKKRNVTDFDTTYINDEGVKIPYSLTYNDFFIIVKGHQKLDGHCVTFCN